MGYILMMTRLFKQAILGDYLIGDIHASETVLANVT
jgi:hypothetical protein